MGIEAKRMMIERAVPGERHSGFGEREEGKEKGPEAGASAEAKIISLDERRALTEEAVDKVEKLRDKLGVKANLPAAEGKRPNESIRASDYLVKGPLKA